VNTRNPDQTSEDYADPETGEYELLVTHGDHTIAYETNGIERYRRDIHLPLTCKADSFIIPPTVLPVIDFTVQSDAGDEKNLIFSGRDTLTSPLVVEPDLLLIVRPERPEVIAEKRAEAISKLEKSSEEEAARKENATEDVETPATLPDEKSGKNGSLWYLWLIAGAGLLFLLIILLRKKDRDKEKE
jgi:hypothetical protein